MSLLPILLVAAVMVVDGGMTPIGINWPFNHTQVAAFTLVPVVLILLALHIALVICDRRLKRGRGPDAFLTADRLCRWARAAIILNHIGSIMVFGWLGTVRSQMGNPILIDEALAITPAVLGLMAIWWLHYPIDRRLHEALLIRTLDEGRVLYPSLSRWGFVVLQMRLHLLLVLTPVLAIVGLNEVIDRAGESFNLQPSYGWMLSVGKVFVGAGVFILAPLMARLVLDVRSLPQGSHRQALEQVAAAHHVAFRDVLEWRTNGSVFNAAVMGLVGRLRYVLITDALLDTLREDEIRAVMAHEIGHVRRRHLIWLVVCLLASFALPGLAMAPLIYAIEDAQWMNSTTANNMFGMAIMTAQLILALLIFGWVCRRFERQADTFAVQHLSRFPSSIESEEPTAMQQLGASPAPETAIVTADSVHTMCEALNAIAELNAIEHHRPSWRHGSIAWRMEYLLTLVGQPLSRLAIDRTVARIKIISAIVMCGAIAYSIIEYLQSGRAAT